MGQDSQVAVFIDYDNIEISVEEAFGKNADVDWNRVLQSASQLGRVVMRRAYADWAEAAARQRQLLALGVELVHVNSKRGKNAADIRIVIDALELFHNDGSSFTHVMLVSGDGDFTELVHRLRAHGKTVIGMGISGTSAEYLVNACDKFIYYDKLQGVSKVKKTPQNGAGQNPLSAKQSNGSAIKPGIAVATTPEGKFEQYLSLLAARKIRIADADQRPFVIYKMYELVKNAAEPLTFNQLKEEAQAFYESAAPKIEPQVVLDVAHQLFHTFCFEFDPDSHERILNRRMFFAADVQKAADLLDKCDRKILQLLISDLGSPDKLDVEVLARLLYGGARSHKVLDHIADLMAVE
ncbi:MAG: NYN domain-containing protein [Chloroflexi bacterium]|nr:NYN domain-containing protein [Chloroflexota bacterium]